MNNPQDPYGWRFSKEINISNLIAIGAIIVGLYSAIDNRLDSQEIRLTSVEQTQDHNKALFEIQNKNLGGRIDAQNTTIKEQNDTIKEQNIVIQKLSESIIDLTREISNLREEISKKEGK